MGGAAGGGVDDEGMGSEMGSEAVARSGQGGGWATVG